MWLRPVPRIPLAISCSAALGLLVRGAAVLAYQGTPFTERPVGDSTSYLDLASRIAAGRWGEIGAFFQAPLYPFVLAALPRDEPWLAIAMLQAVAGGLAAGVIAALGRIVYPRGVGVPWIAGIAAAIYGPLVYYDLQILPASLAASLGAFGLLLAARPASSGRACAAGCTLAAATLLAPGMLLVVGLAAIPILGGRAPASLRARLVRGASFLAGVALLLAPFAVHNRRTGGPLFVSSAGVNAFVGNNAEATGSFYLPPGSGLDGAHLESSARAVAERERGRSLSAAEASAFWMARARAWIASDPRGALALAGRKALLVINHYEIPNQLDYQFVAGRFLPALGAALPFWIVFSLAGLGAVAALALGSPAGYLVVGAAVAELCVPVLYFATGRYRLPAAPALLVLAAGGLSWWLGQVSRRSWSGAATGAALVALLAASTRIVLVREGDFAFEHALLGGVEAERGDLDAAVLELKLAEETGAPDLFASLRLASVLERRGNSRAALRALGRHVLDHPDDRRAARILETAGEGSEGPPVPLTAFETGTELQARGDLEGAVHAYERAIDADPAHVRALVALALVSRRTGALDVAHRAARRAARLAPGDPAVAALRAELGP